MSLTAKADPKFEYEVKPKGKERHREVFIAEDVWWCLSAKCKALEIGPVDQFIDDLLRQWCREHLPDLVKLRERRDELYQQQKNIDAEAVKVAAKTSPAGTPQAMT